MHVRGCILNQPMKLDRDGEQACQLLQEYSFDLGGYRPGELVVLWQDRLEAESSWIRSAVLEALYQGRYKAFSVEQLLRLWKRRGYPIRHFNHEFERVALGPIDAVASKYAPMTTLSPSELMTPQSQTSVSHSGNAFEAVEAMAQPKTTSQLTPFTEAESLNPESPNLESLNPVRIPESDIPPSVSFPQTSEWVAPPNSITSAAVTPHPIPLVQPQPIRKFIPQPKPSEFYTRLQSVARHSF